MLDFVLAVMPDRARELLDTNQFIK